MFPLPDPGLQYHNMSSLSSINQQSIQLLIITTHSKHLSHPPLQPTSLVLWKHKRSNKTGTTKGLLRHYHPFIHFHYQPTYHTQPIISALSLYHHHQPTQYFFLFLHLSRFSIHTKAILLFSLWKYTERE